LAVTILVGNDTTTQLRPSHCPEYLIKMADIPEDEKPKSKRVFVNCVDSYQAKNIAKVRLFKS